MKVRLKTKLGNSEIRPIVDNLVSEGLGEFFEENPVIAKRIVEKSSSFRQGTYGST